MTTPVAAPRKFPSRWFSAVEFAVGAAIVLGHNVWHKVPNEVPILFVLGMLSLHFRDGLKSVGFARPKSWPATVGIALAAAALRLGFGAAWEPIAARFWPPIKGPEGMEQIHADWKTALMWLAIIWTFAAFGEEISYRGYLLTRFADLGGRTAAAYWAAVIASSILFGFGHYYKGPTGVVDSAVAGLILGAAYMINRKNLWTTILAHGFIDTIGVIAVFMGWSN